MHESLLIFYQHVKSCGFSFSLTGPFLESSSKMLTIRPWLFEKWTTLQQIFFCQQINRSPGDSMVCFVNTYPLDSNLSGG